MLRTHLGGGGGVLGVVLCFGFLGLLLEWMGIGMVCVTGVLGLFFWAFCGAVFSLGPWCFPFSSFVLFLCYWGLKSSGPGNCLWILFFCFFLYFFFVDSRPFLNIELNLAYFT